MKTEEIKTVTKAVNELNESYADLIRAIKGSAREAEKARKLWMNGNKSRLIKLGLALIVFPEPTPISETVGASLVVIGAIQMSVRRRSLHVEDIRKTFQNTLKEIRDIKCNI